MSVIALNISVSIRVWQEAESSPDGSNKTLIEVHKSTYKQGNAHREVSCLTQG